MINFLLGFLTADLFLNLVFIFEQKTRYNNLYSPLLVIFLIDLSLILFLLYQKWKKI